MKRKKIRILAIGLIALAITGGVVKSYAGCLECTTGTNNGKCYMEACSTNYVSSVYCCGTTCSTCL